MRAHGVGFDCVLSDNIVVEGDDQRFLDGRYEGRHVLRAARTMVFGEDVGRDLAVVADGAKQVEVEQQFLIVDKRVVIFLMNIVAVAAAVFDFDAKHFGDSQYVALESADVVFLAVFAVVHLVADVVDELLGGDIFLPALEFGDDAEVA